MEIDGNYLINWKYFLSTQCLFIQGHSSCCCLDCFPWGWSGFFREQTMRLAAETVIELTLQRAPRGWCTRDSRVIEDTHQKWPFGSLLSPNLPLFLSSCLTLVGEKHLEKHIHFQATRGPFSCRQQEYTNGFLMAQAPGGSGSIISESILSSRGKRHYVNLDNK